MSGKPAAPKGGGKPPSAGGSGKKSAAAKDKSSPVAAIATTAAAESDSRSELKLRFDEAKLSARDIGESYKKKIQEHCTVLDDVYRLPGFGGWNAPAESFDWSHTERAHWPELMFAILKNNITRLGQYRNCIHQMRTADQRATLEQAGAKVAIDDSSSNTTTDTIDNVSSAAPTQDPIENVSLAGQQGEQVDDSVRDVTPPASGAAAGDGNGVEDRTTTDQPDAPAPAGTSTTTTTTTDTTSAAPPGADEDTVNDATTTIDQPDAPAAGASDTTTTTTTDTTSAAPPGADEDTVNDATTSAAAPAASTTGSAGAPAPGASASAAGSSSPSRARAPPAVNAPGEAPSLPGVVSQTPAQAWRGAANPNSVNGRQRNLARALTGNLRPDDEIIERATGLKGEAAANFDVYSIPTSQADLQPTENYVFPENMGYKDVDSLYKNCDAKVRTLIDRSTKVVWVGPPEAPKRWLFFSGAGQKTSPVKSVPVHVTRDVMEDVYKIDSVDLPADVLNIDEDDDDAATQRPVPYVITGTKAELKANATNLKYKCRTGKVGDNDVVKAVGIPKAGCKLPMMQLARVQDCTPHRKHCARVVMEYQPGGRKMPIHEVAGHLQRALGDGAEAMPIGWDIRVYSPTPFDHTTVKKLKEAKGQNNELLRVKLVLPDHASIATTDPANEEIQLDQPTTAAVHEEAKQSAGDGERAVVLEVQGSASVVMLPPQWQRLAAALKLKVTKHTSVECAATGKIADVEKLIGRKILDKIVIYAAGNRTFADARRQSAAVRA